MALVPSNDVWETLAYCYSTRLADAERVGAWLDLPAIGGRRRLAKWYERLARRVRKPTKLLVPTIVTAVVLSIGAMVGGGFLIAWLSQFQKVRWTFGIIGAVMLAIVIVKRPGARKRRARWTLWRRSERWRLAVRARQPGFDGEAARADLNSRTHLWKAALGRKAPVHRVVGVLMMREDTKTALLVFFLFAFALALFGANLPFSPANTSLLFYVNLGIMGCYMVPWIAGLYFRRWLQRRISSTLRDSTCSDCGYDLRGVPCGITAAPEFGPRRCPECMLRWPLVPPRAPGDHGTTAQPASASRDSENPFTSQ